jgi:hypothetical protein
MTDVDVKKLKREANTRLAKAQHDESVAGHGTLERAEAHSRVRAAQDDLYRLDNPVEEEVVLLSPNPAMTGEDAIGTWENGRTTVPRSVAERMCAEFPEYAIEEDAS